MEKYLNKSGNSPITFYEINNQSVTVSFRGAAKSYTYSYSKAGSMHVDKMKSLAMNGSGLSAYITRNVKLLYD